MGLGREEREVLDLLASLGFGVRSPRAHRQVTSGGDLIESLLPHVGEKKRRRKSWMHRRRCDGMKRKEVRGGDNSRGFRRL